MCLLLLGATFVWLRWTNGTLIVSAQQPGGAATAEVRLWSFAAATDADSLIVQIRDGWLSPPKVIFQASDYGESVSVGWAGPNALVIYLKNTERLHIYRANRQWHGVTISYQIKGGAPTPTALAPKEEHGRVGNARAVATATIVICTKSSVIGFRAHGSCSIPRCLPLCKGTLHA